ncbi:hypothetical protein [Paraglaciecola sp. MB-3u-78]|jgi:hypothetical protein|uniref:hypothetical protein n=1 Tax=Paraglaciecola sp. MB-3u-78 TaxID=2058332 RepID=UPI000C31C72B|nr:hypothetical protein [Paraglaciecola sp. MB-3u-78]PKG96973.1 hypothetical protein CXF95_21945 [Paraglaciecola sp. MB-3u-78]
MANAKEINQVVEAFELWRHNRGSRKSPTPQALRKQAVDLLEHCTYSNVTSMLRISGSQLKQWRESVKPSQTNHDFIQLPARSEAQHSINKHPIIELRLCNGAALTFAGQISQALLVTMIQEAKP